MKSEDRRERTPITVYGESEQSVVLTPTTELGELLDLAALINQQTSTEFHYSFNALLLAFVYGRHRISSWFKDYMSKASIDLAAILNSQDLKGGEGQIRRLAIQKIEPDSLYSVGRRRATVSALRWIELAKKYSDEQKHSWVGLRHLMGAVIFTQSLHDEELQLWRFDRPGWALEYLRFVEETLPKDLEFWKRVDARVFPRAGTPSVAARAAYLLTWDPDRYPFQEFQATAQKIQENGVAELGWSTGNNTSILVGDRVFLMRQDRESRGLVGAGFVKSGITTEPHWDPGQRAQGRMYHRALINWQTLREMPVLPLKALVTQTEEADVWDSESGGVRIPDNVAERLETVWRKVSSETSERRVQGDSDAVPVAGEARGLPTYAADSAVGPDLIGITREVEAMASLVSAWSVEPPLSIGLFGEWGSGKSFFMQKMKERVRQIASEARKAGKGQKEFGYYKNIVQVEFNAWHYVEGNLWASLVEHIFSNLRLEGIGEEAVDSEEYVRKRLENLLGQVREKTTEAEQREKVAEKASREAEEEKREAEELAKKLETEAEMARERARTAEEEGLKAEQRAADKQREADAAVLERDNVGMKDIIEEVKGSAEIRDLVQKDLGVLGITKERIETVQGLRDALNEASDAGTVIGEGIKILTHDKQRWWLLAWVVAGPAIAAGLVWGGAWLTAQQNAPWLHSIYGVVSVVGTMIAGTVGFWKRYSPKLKPFLDAVANLKEKRAILEQRVEKARRERAELAGKLDVESRKKKEEAIAETKLAEQKVSDAELARREAKEKQDQADRATQLARTARAEAGRLRRDAEALLPERRIAAFIQDRAGARDYRRHLGVPALIRRDFEKLSAMFNTQRDEEGRDRDGRAESGVDLPGRNDLSIVNRIILYIDDLDRCPQGKVVEVLRAIHLLLAFPLFVVVVAVDPRWMKRSLRDRFSLMLTSPQKGSDASSTTSKDEELALGTMATPDDYLEKIFQVPFWIRPLSPNACKNLVNALTKDDVESQSDATRTTTHSSDSGDSRSTGRGERTGSIAENVSSMPTGAGGVAESRALAESGRAAGVDTAARSTKPLDEGGAFKWSLIEPKPRTLQLTKDERDYMLELASVIGRSPRSVKRFVNCYRLLKAALDKDDLAQATRDGTFRTTMLLLGMVTGLPDIAPALLADLRQTENTKTPEAWAHAAAKRLQLDKRERWGDLLPAIVQLKEGSNVSTIRPFVEAADLVDRFSFSPVRTPAAAGS